MALKTILLPYGYYPDPTKGRPVSNGSIFIGEPDLDPEIVANQKVITLRQESGDTPSASQPVATSSGGVPTFNGSPAEILVDGEYSIKVLNSQGAQVYYSASNNSASDSISSDQRHGVIFETTTAMTAANPASIDGSEVDLVAGMRVETKIHTTGILGGGVYVVESGDTSDGNSRLLLANGNTAVLQCLLGRVDGAQFGITGTGDEFAKVQAAIKFAYDNQATDLVFPTDTQVSISEAVFWNSYGVLTNSQNIWNLNVLLTQATAGGAVVNIGRGADVGNGDDIERTGKVIFHNPRIDGGSIAGENGFGLARAEDVVILNPIVRNCKRDYVGTREGGRAITVHDRCRNITVMNHNAINCSDAFHVATLPDYDSADSGNTTITSITLGNPTTVVLTANTFAVGNFVTLYGVGGTTELNPAYRNTAQYEVLTSVSNTLTLDVDSTAFTAYTSGGNCVRADLTGGGRAPAVQLLGMYAEDCEYSLINVEAANWPHSIDAYQTAYMNGIVAKNCGTTSATRGLINGNNAQGVQIHGLAVYNDSSNPIQSIVRGSFQNSVIKGVYDVHTITGSVIDADPTLENPTGTGIDAGIGTHPFGTSLDNEYDMNVIYRGDQTDIDSLIHVTDLGGSSIDRFYRNRINIAIGGLADGGAYTGLVNNVAIHFSNWVTITDTSFGSSAEGSYSSGSLGISKVGGAKEYVDDLHIRSGTTASFKALNGNGDIKGRIDYTLGDDRYRMYLGDVQAYQFTINNILPNTDNLKDLGSGGLRMRTIYAGTGTINTSDIREKQDVRDISDVEKAVALQIKSELKKFRFNDAVQIKGPGARIHFGAMAQEVGAVFTDHGLNPNEYAMFCYDEWEDEYTDIKDEATGETSSVLTLAAGNRYGLRYDELLVFIIAAM